MPLGPFLWCGIRQGELLSEKGFTFVPSQGSVPMQLKIRLHMSKQGIPIGRTLPVTPQPWRYEVTTMEDLNDVFRMVFDDDTIQITPEMTANDLDGWDSLSHVNLIVAVEVRFSIRFTRKELLTLKKIDDLYNAVAAKISVKAA